MSTCITRKHRQIMTAVVENIITDDTYFTPDSDFYTAYHTDEVIACKLNRLDGIIYSGTKYPTCSEYEEESQK